jgi:sodium/bile acid cotransporter 7
MKEEKHRWVFVPPSSFLLYPFLRKRWFLLLLLTGLGLAWLQPDPMRSWTAFVHPRAVVAVAIFLTALSLPSDHLLRSFLRPFPPLLATAISYGVLPLLGSLVIRLLPDADLQTGVMIIVSVPCTLASAVLWTRMAGGNEAAALLVVVATTATSWLITTAWLAWALGAAVQVEAGAMMLSLLTVLIAPVALGQLIRALTPVGRAAERHKQALGVVSQLLVLLIVLKAAVDVRVQIGEGATRVSMAWLAATALLCAALHLTGVLGGLGIGTLLGFDRHDRIAVAFAGSQKTLPVALYLFITYFRESYPWAILPVVFYHIGQLFLDTFIAEWLKRDARPTAISLT